MFKGSGCIVFFETGSLKTFHWRCLSQIDRGSEALEV